VSGGRGGGWLAVALWTITLAVFWPAVRWLLSVTLDQRQLLQAFVVFGFSGLLLILGDSRLKAVWRFETGSIRGLFASYVLVGLAMGLGSPHLILAALCIAIWAAVRFIYGDVARRGSLWVVLAFGLYLFFIVAMPFFDWPLRILSGRFAAWVLDIMGKHVQLFVVLRPEPSLMLLMGDRVFEVAAECNGFGLLSSSCLLALVLAGASTSPWIIRTAKWIGCAALGFGANIVRIVVICLLSGWAGQTHYHTMHEVVGTACVVAALGAVWWLWRRRV